MKSEQKLSSLNGRHAANGHAKNAQKRFKVPGDGASLDIGRDVSGKFAKGNKGGPGRPRRTVERDYLCVLADTVTLDAWREVCLAAVEAAKQGDRHARDWIARYLLGEKPGTLLDLSADEVERDCVKEEVVGVLTDRFQKRQDKRFIDHGLSDVAEKMYDEAMEGRREIE